MRILTMAAIFASALSAQLVQPFTTIRPAKPARAPLSLVPPLNQPQAAILSHAPAVCATPLLLVRPRDVDPGILHGPAETSRMPQVTPPAPSCVDGK